MDRLNWIFELVDGISDPAKTVHRSLRSVQSASSLGAESDSLRGWGRR